MVNGHIRSRSWMRYGGRTGVFLIDVCLVTVISAPLWAIAEGYGTGGAMLSGLVTGVLFAALWSFIYSETPAGRLIRFIRTRGKSLRQ